MSGDTTTIQVGQDGADATLLQFGTLLQFETGDSVPIPQFTAPANNTAGPSLPTPLTQPQFRTFLGLGSAALAATTDFDPSGAAGARLAKASNLTDLTDPAAARTALSLGSAALLASSALAQTANNLSEYTATAATARTNIGLGSVATRNTGTVAGTAMVGDQGAVTAQYLHDPTVTKPGLFLSIGANAGTVNGPDATKILSAERTAQNATYSKATGVGGVAIDFIPGNTIKSALSIVGNYINDSTTGQIFQSASFLKNIGTAPAVAVFGMAVAAHGFGANFAAYCQNDGDSNIGIEIDYGSVLDTSTIPGSTTIANGLVMVSEGGQLGGPGPYITAGAAIQFQANTNSEVPYGLRFHSSDVVNKNPFGIAFFYGDSAMTPSYIMDMAATRPTAGMFNIPDGGHFRLPTTNAAGGVKFGTASNQFWAMWGATPITQPVGTTDILAGLISTGIRATGANPPLNMGTGALTAGSAHFTTTLAVDGATTFGQDVTLNNGQNLITGSGSGSRIFAGTGAKGGLFSATPIVQPAGWTDPTGTFARAFLDVGATVEQMRQTLNALIHAMFTLGAIGA